MKKEHEQSSQLTEKPPRGLISKLLWTLAIPATAPYMFNITKNNKEVLAILLLIGTAAFKIYSSGFMISEEVTKEKYTIEQVELLNSTYKLTIEIGEFQAFNNEIDSDYLKLTYMVASVVSTIPISKIGLMWLDKQDNFYSEQSITGEYHYYFTDKKTGNSSFGGRCEVVVDKENFNKLNEIDSYILGFGGNDAYCEYSWGYKRHGMATKDFGWAHKKLQDELTIYNDNKK